MMAPKDGILSTIRWGGFFLLTQILVQVIFPRFSVVDLPTSPWQSSSSSPPSYSHNDHENKTHTLRFLCPLSCSSRALTSSSSSPTIRVTATLPVRQPGDQDSLSRQTLLRVHRSHRLPRRSDLLSHPGRPDDRPLDHHRRLHTEPLDDSRQRGHSRPAFPKGIRHRDVREMHLGDNLLPPRRSGI